MNLNFTHVFLRKRLSMMVALFTFASVLHAQILVYSGFENAKPPAPPEGWSVSHTGTANWQSLRSFMGSGNMLNGQKCMYLANSYNGDQSDAWLFTPAFAVEAGKKYSISFYYKNQVNGSNTMEVTMGNEANPGAQTEVVWLKKFNNIYYEEAQVNFTATETGTKVLAIHCITPKTFVYVYIDDLTIKTTDCFEPLNIRVTNITTESATFIWDAIDGARGYIYGISDTMVPPTNTRPTENNKIRITGLKSSKKYYLYVRSSCAPGVASDWAIKEFSTAYDASAFATISCGQVIENNFTASQGKYLNKQCGTIYGGREFFHKFTPEVSGYYNLDVFAVNTGQYMKFMYKEASKGAGPDGWSCITQDIGDFGGKATFGPLEAGKEYIIMEKARAWVNLPSSYAYGIECFKQAPPNDNCNNALALTPVTYNDQCEGTWVTTVGATASDLKGNYDECGYWDNVNDDDVWVKFTATADQQLFRINNMRYSNFYAPNSMPGIYFNIFSNPCDLKSLVDCGYIPVESNTQKDFYTYKLKAGQTYYCRIFTADKFTYARFRLCIMNLDVAKGTPNSCTGLYPYSIDPYTDGGNTTRLVPFTDEAYKLVHFIKAEGNELGLVSGGLYINGGPLRKDNNGVYYLDRNLTIIPSMQPSSPVTVRILVSNAEIEKLINQPGSGVTSAQDLRITQNTDDCAAAFTNAATSFIIPDQVTDYNSEYKLIQFKAERLGSYYIHGGNMPLSSKSGFANSDKQSNATPVQISIYPNPVKSNVSIGFRSEKAAKYTLSITDLQGKPYKTIRQSASTGINTIAVDATGFPKGIYMVKLQINDTVAFAKIIKE